ncbi:MAG: NAD-dependent epimerase/dehydratase family protein [Verrucomicrobiota bacterium]
MKVLFIGGTGNISTASSRLAISQGIELHLLNRGTQPNTIDEAHSIRADINDFRSIQNALEDQVWDCVVNWIAFNPSDINRDLELFMGKTKQYIFISSASAYQKPLTHPVITESTPLKNPYWEYSRNKIDCESILNSAYRSADFPVTIIRPSLTYDTVIPVPLGGWKEYTIIDRIKSGRPVVIHGDGTSLWTITHSEDFAKALIGLIGHPQSIGHSFHITSDEILTWNEIYQILAGAVNKDLNSVHITSHLICKHLPEMTGGLLGDKAESVIFDNTKIKQFVPDFQATIPFHRGIRKTLDWFQSNPTRMIIKEETHQKIDDLIAACA